jgi:ribonucleoside-triphosphate reductase
MKAFRAIHDILNRCAGNLLDEIDIGDVFNWCGDVLSNRRAAEMLLMDDHNPRVAEFAVRKEEYWNGNPQRRQSNDSILFWKRPPIKLIGEMLEENHRRGDPGFFNATAALRRCPWFRTANPCAEILLASHSFCNLVSVCLPDFGRNYQALERAIWTMARANYRQTCVDLKDGVLQPRWHQTNEALRLCGVSLTGVVQADWLTDYQIVRLRNSAVAGAYSMADELGMPRPKAICTIKPEGTRSKISGRLGREVAEGIHKPLGRYVFNWINFSNDDPIAHGLVEAGYKSLPNPSDLHNTLIRFPVDYSGCLFDRVEGKEVNAESALDQLRRYRRWNNLWCDYNVSCTINFDREEIPAMADWIYRHWDDGYVATAFLARTDATKTAADLGHPYLPQEVVTEEAYRSALEGERAVDWGKYHHGWFDIGDGSDCSKGSCPVK